ncbi:MAG: TIGR03960 family B12-binding radical SAM protein [Candidatus Latescibacterota bacterium]|nr:MAG: TIGR03960 family B12-binding radical SAM protein [Candidatus Latescibacterota bacterium]
MCTEVLGMVEKPVRYIGGEWNQVVKPARDDLVRVGLAFPDTYEIGMSHLGIRILYDLLNRQDDLAAERVFCPWVDMEEVLRRYELPLATLESRIPLRQLDVVGFSLQFEMEYTNVLTMLDLSGIPLHSRERGVEVPLIVAGGPCVFSPEPMADFIDAFVIGDGEEAFPQLVRRWAELRREGGRTREQMLVELSRQSGIYVPSLYRTELDPETGFEIVTGARPGLDPPFPVQRAVVEDLDRYPFPSETIVPYGEIVHDRVSVEIARGCTEGCRFCQAGIIYRPVRERSPAEIIRSVSKGLMQTGYDEASLTSLSTADYSCVTALVKTMMNRFEQDRTAMAVSSMRVYGLTKSIAEQLARVRRTGFTIAPEAGTQRMRDLINKGVTDADVEMAARIAWEQGWGQLKMYFMIGLPTETDTDVRAIAETGIRVWRLAREMGHRRAQVTVSASALVPKPHSTFQWEPMERPDELRRKQRLILDAVRPYRPVRFKYDDVEEGAVECILSRGDRRIGRVIEAAWRRGARFDSWSDHFDYARWISCLEEAGLDPEVFLRRIPLHAKLPWDHIDSRVQKEFLIRDLHAGMQGRFLPACEKPFIPRDPNKAVKPLEHANLVCYDCGLDCDLEAIKQERIEERDSLTHAGEAIEAAFRGERAGSSGDGASAPVPRRQAAARSDGLASNAFEAASGSLHGEAGGREPSPVRQTADAPARPQPQLRLRYRVLFAKRGDLRWLSHLDLMRTLQRAFKRANVPVSYSQGYHPQPLMAFGPALAVGIEGARELFDFESSRALDPESTRARLNASLPASVRILQLERLSARSATLSKCIDLAEYSAWPNEERRKLTPELFDGLDDFGDPAAQRRRISALMERQTLVVTRTGKKARTLDIRPFIRGLEYRPERRQLRLWLRLGDHGQARPREVLEALYGVSGACFRVRRESLLSEQDTGVSPETVIA